MKGNTIFQLYTEGQRLRNGKTWYWQGEGHTRSGIIERNKTTVVYKMKRNIVHVTNKGKMMVEAIKRSAIGSPEITAKWEVYFEGIGEGKKG